MKEQERPAEGVIEGRNAVTEALRAGTPMDKLYIAKGETDRTLSALAAQARKAGVVVVECDRRKLDAMSETHSHQGVIALAAAKAYATVEDILAAARERGEPPLIVVCDEISDPRYAAEVVAVIDARGECPDARHLIAWIESRISDKFSDKWFKDIARLILIFVKIGINAITQRQLSGDGPVIT